MDISNIIGETEATPMLIKRGGTQQTGGRPKKTMDARELQRLLNMRVSIKDIAFMYGVNERTVWRRIKEYNLIKAEYSDTSDEALDKHIQDILAFHPNAG